MQSYRPKNIKEHNQKFITKILRESEGPLTKSQLAKKTELSVVTINKILPEMISIKKITELDSPVHTGGRRALVYQLNKLFHVLLIIQLIEKKDQISALFVATDLGGTIISDKEFVINELSRETILQGIHAFKKEFPSLNTIIVGIPGVEMGGKLKIVDYAPFLNLNFEELIKEENISTIYVENDINAATLGFADKDKMILSGLYFPKSFPPGSSLIINGKIFHGKNNLSGEIKHLPSYQKITYPIKEAIELSIALNHALQTIVSMYDPEEIVVFVPSDWIEKINISTIYKKLEELFPYGVLPRITISDDFEKYHQKGLIKIGLDLIEPLI